MGAAPAMLWSNSPLGATPASLIYDNPLISQLWPSKAVGNATPTFAASGAGGFVTDWEGCLRRCKANEARFTGARRVQNIVAGSSQNLTISPWGTYVQSTGVVPVLTWAYGGSSATRLQLNRGTDTVNGASGMYQFIPSAVVPATAMTGYWRISFSAQALSGTPTIAFGAGGGTANMASVTLGASWVRYSVMVNLNINTNLALFVGVFGSNQGGVGNSQTADFVITWVMAEVMNAHQSNFNPGEYVSVGMGDQVYANVDGVRYFPYKNGNTMTGNVMNEITGNIPLTTPNGASSVTCDRSSPLGLLMEGPQTVVYSIEWDFTAVGAANMTYGAKADWGPTGELLACNIIETTANAAHYINPFATLPYAITHSFCGFFVRPSTRTNIQNNFSIGNDTAVIRWDLTGNGAVTYAGMGGTGGGVIRASGIIPFKGGWYYCWVSMSGTVASAAMNIGLFAEYGGAYAGTGGVAWQLYGLTVMDLDDAYSLRPASYAYATRGVDTLSCVGSQNFSPNQGTAYCEIRTKWQTAGNHRPIIAGDNYAKCPLFGHGGYPSTTMTMYDTAGAVVMQTGLPDAFTAVRKIASSWSNATGTMLITGSGTPAASGPFPATTMTGSTIGIGYSGWTGIGVSGNIRNVRFWNFAATSSELAALTAGVAGRIADRIDHVEPLPTTASLPPVALIE
jgi:hypothetical protein